MNLLRIGLKVRFFQEPRARLKISLSALLDFRFEFALLALQIDEIGLTIRTPNYLQMKFDVVEQLRIKRLKEERAELLTGRAREMIASPNCPHRMVAAVDFLDDFAVLLANFCRFTKGLFDASSILGRKRIFGIPEKQFAWDEKFVHCFSFVDGKSEGCRKYHGRKEGRARAHPGMLRG